MIRRRYYEWLLAFVCDDKYHGKYYTKLFDTLYSIEFTWDLPLDENRYEDGIGLRHRFAYEFKVDLDPDLYPLEGPCTMLEMMVALAVRAEETVMRTAEYGDRTGDWFWGMVINMGIYDQDDGNFDEKKVRKAVRKVLLRTYTSTGKGGLFTVKHPRNDLRRTDIWCQMMWYLADLGDNDFDY